MESEYRIAEAEEDNSEKSMPPLNHPSRNYEFRLPSVKKLAKQFTADEIKTSSSLHSNERLNTENGTESNIRTWCSQEKEPEIDYSSVPISEIILNLKNALSSSNSSATPPPRTQTDQVKSKGNKELIDEKGERKTEKIVMARFNAKEIHSLTARSISREFREGLKSGTDQNHKTVVNCFEGNEWNNCIKSSSPTPSIDLKNMKKFWEEIITANAKLNK
ncbi:hypothetical protein RUM43_014547 [Polyplax serrata]|uniref:Uncharacterized protein n=1 Tax=Polyplax serrata TaxID=468196 RepID=A0AAN8PGQ6_POLSC